MLNEKEYQAGMQSGVKVGILVGMVLMLAGAFGYSYFFEQDKVDNFVSTTCDCTNLVDTGDCKIIISGMLSQNSQISIETDKPISIINNTFYMNESNNSAIRFMGVLN